MRIISKEEESFYRYICKECGEKKYYDKNEKDWICRRCNIKNGR